jgi:hypothetical protein
VIHDFYRRTDVQFSRLETLPPADAHGKPHVGGGRRETLQTPRLAACKSRSIEPALNSLNRSRS